MGKEALTEVDATRYRKSYLSDLRVGSLLISGERRNLVFARCLDAIPRTILSRARRVYLGSPRLHRVTHREAVSV